ncbi:MAG TPA: hypothetical protein VGO45_00580 [Bacteroidia bacterium]|nr:hypothetical protein [Bacteroidia bacterium]
MKNSDPVEIETQKQALIGFIKKNNPFYQFVDFSLYDLEQLSIVIHKLRNKNTISNC